MTTENDPKSETIRTEDTPALRWEKRIVMYIIMAMLGYMVSIAMNMDTKVSVMANDVRHIVSSNVKQDKLIEANSKNIINHEKRLVKVEITVDNLKK